MRQARRQGRDPHDRQLSLVGQPHLLYQIDLKYRFAPLHRVPRVLRFSPRLYAASRHDRRRGDTGTFKDARWHFPGSAVVDGQYSYGYDVKPGSNWYMWIRFLLARYHRDSRVYDAVELGRYRLAPGLNLRTAGAHIDYFEFVNEPNGPQGWPQQGTMGACWRTGSSPTCSAAPRRPPWRWPRRPSSWPGTPPRCRRPTLLGPSATDDVNGSGRLATTVATFTNAVLAQLYPRGGARFDGSDLRALFIWSQHNYGDIERQRYGRWRGGRVDVDAHNAAALANDILLKRGWNGVRDRGDVRSPWVYLTEGGARMEVLEFFHKTASQQALRKLQADLLGRNWEQMSNRTTGERLGLGIGMLTNFLFYDNPGHGKRNVSGVSGNRSGLMRRLAPRGDGSSPPPRDLGHSRESPAYDTWAGLMGEPTVRPGAP